MRLNGGKKYFAYRYTHPDHPCIVVFFCATQILVTLYLKGCA